MRSHQLARQAVEVSATLKTLAHPVRLKILCSLVEGEKTVSEIIAYCGASQSWVSQFLGRMRLEGLVEARKEGNFSRYRIADPQLRELMSSIYRIYCNKKKESQS